jgi:hypothetical protein
MIALRLVRLIEDHSDELSETLLEKFRQSPRTTDFARVPAQELHDRIHELLQHLGDWLLYKQEREIEFRYREIGLRRSAQHVSLSDYCWAFLITKEHIWDFLQRQGFLRSPVEIYGELELLRLLDQFFDRALYFVTEGYEQAQASGAARVSEPSVSESLSA